MAGGREIFDRYKQHGLEALCDRSRRPVRYANPLPAHVEAAIVEANRPKPHWGSAQYQGAQRAPTTKAS